MSSGTSPSVSRRSPRRLLAGPIEFGRACTVRFLALQGIDRAMALAAQAFTALIPLMIVYSALVEAHGHDFAERLVTDFHLHGSAARAVRDAFAPAGAVASQTSVFGALLLVVSALSFTRALQRLYQLTWDQRPLGLAAAKWGLAWLVLVVAVLTFRPLVLYAVHGVWRLVLSLAFAAAVWLITPYVLLGRRVGWRRLMPTALMTAVGITTLSISSAVWLPRTIVSSAEQFGVIGVAFALLSWLVGAGVVLVGTAACGRALEDWRRTPAEERSALRVSVATVAAAAREGRDAAPAPLSERSP
jgi:membrane protein